MVQHGDRRDVVEPTSERQPRAYWKERQARSALQSRLRRYRQAKTVRCYRVSIRWHAKGEPLLALRALACRCH